MYKHQTKKDLTDAGLAPIKYAGQNFLVSEEIIEKIISAAKIKKGETILEIGPGNLTEALLTKGAKVMAVEKDTNLSKLLNSKLQISNPKQITNTKLQIINCNILEFDETTIKQPYRIIANIPYYLTGKLLQKFLLSKNKPSSMMLMVQKEVGERITANPPKMNYLSAFVQTMASTEMLFLVGKDNFWPKPKVDSAFIRIVPHKTDINKPFIFFLKTAFKQPRKTLLNNLRGGNIKNAEEIITKLGFDKNIRAQNLSLELLKKIFKLAS
jgi:16S rRNA (adenine1518-N6/adenine1519-N6)-dimethyltransferase